MIRALLCGLAAGAAWAGPSDDPACSAAPSVASAQQALFAAQTELQAAKGPKATSKALEDSSRAQQNYMLAFSCQQRYSVDFPDPGSGARRLPPVPTTEGAAPPGYSPFSAEDGPAAQGIRYNQPGGMDNARDTAPRGRPPERPATPKADPPPAAPASPSSVSDVQPVKDGARPALIRAAEPAPARESGSGDPERLLDAAGRQFDFGDLDGALRTARRALAADPKNAAARALEAQILCGMGRVEEARASARRALALDPQDPAAREALFCRPGSPRGSLLELVRSAERKMEFGDYLGALLDAERALAADPAAAAAYRVKAQVLCGLGRYEEARDAALKAIAIDGQDPASREALAWALANLGDYAGAAKAASRALELDPESAFAYAIRAFARDRLGDRAGGLADMAQAASRSPAYSGQYAAARAGQGLAAPSPPGKSAPGAAKPPEEPSGPPVWPAVTAVSLVLLLLAGCAFFALRR